MSTRKTFLAAICLAFFMLVLVGVEGAQAASLQLSPSSGSHEEGESFNVTVQANSGGQEVNAVSADISFDTNALSVVNVSQAGDVSGWMWPEEPSYSNSAGTVSFAGGSPGSFSGTTNIITISFRMESQGSTEVEFTDGGITSAEADSVGEDVLSSMSSATFTGEESAPEPEPEPEPDPDPAYDPADYMDPPDRPRVSSDTHPDSEQWYSTREAEFSWDVPDTVDRVRLGVSQEPDTTPSVEHEPPIDSRELDEEYIDEDGVWYFHVQFGNAAGWGDITHYEFRVDTQEPEEFEVEKVDGEGTPRPTIEFQTEDEISGVAEYVINAEGVEEVVREAEDHEDAHYRYIFDQDLREGLVIITVTARDRAGNETTAELEVDVEAPEEDDVGYVPEEEEDLGFWEQYAATVFILILLLIIGGLVVYIWRLKYLMRENKAKGKKEVQEIRMEMDRIFSALRAETEELLASFDGKKGLSAKEKRVYDKLRNAIDVSEELILKEVEDVEKLMR